MTTPYGKKIGDALRAIRQMHADTSRLLQDCDGIIGANHESVFDLATRDLMWKVNATQWMAEGVFRYYDLAEDQPGLVEGITVAFIEKENPSAIDEPQLIAGQVKYKLKGGSSVIGICKEWDLWNAHFYWFDTPGSAAPIPPKHADRVDWAKLLAAPLYSITSLDHVQRLMNQVRATPHLPDTIVRCDPLPTSVA